MYRSYPTKFDGMQFRSRLEAKWAAFFSLLDWKWEYEPVDLDGYIPDFFVTPKWGYQSDEHILIEVKPLGFADSAADAFEKIAKSGWAHPAAVVGYELRNYDRFTDGGDIQIGRTNHGRSFDIWKDDERLCATYGDKDSGGDVNAPAVWEIQRLWRAAGSAVQWRKPR